MPLTSAIVKAAIHPGIGVARLGNSPDGWFVGPELPYGVGGPEGGYRDELGAIKRQGARFRIYGYDVDGQVVGEITADEAAIAWTVHVANRKAAWYNFDVALDIPGTGPAHRRNAAFSGGDRGQLVIDPGPHTISGRDASGAAYRLDGGSFLNKPVPLGDLRTDERGRLIVLGGRGVAASAFAHSSLYTYANNDGWYDDTSDGPVTAEVRLDGRDIPVDPAWVIVAPPPFAPEVISLPTLYDVVEDASKTLWLGQEKGVSFTEHIYPILAGFVGFQWVNYGFHVQFGWKGPYEFTRPDFLKMLADPSERYAERRRQIFNMFRHPDYKTFDANAWPPMYGDGAEITGSFATDVAPRQYLALTPTQYARLGQWAAGKFEADWPAKAPTAQRIEDVPLAEQPATLDRAALTFCAGGAFHPGYEVTWPMRHVTMYAAPFRLRPRGAGVPEIDYGPQLSPAIALSETGPLFGSGPGDLTRWMSVPWQADAASCRAGYEGAYDPYLPTFWPARVPNHVLARREYERVMDTSLSLDERQAAFETRSTWYRPLRGPSVLDQVNQMVVDFGQLGVLERRDGPKDDANFPAQFYVESRPGADEDVDPQRHLLAHPSLRARRGSR